MILQYYSFNIISKSEYDRQLNGMYERIATDNHNDKGDNIRIDEELSAKEDETNTKVDEELEVGKIISRDEVLNDDGSKTTTTVCINEKLQRVQTVRRTMMKTIKTNIKKSVLLRRNIKKFGACVNSPIGPERGITEFADTCLMEMVDENDQKWKVDKTMPNTR